MTSRRSLLALPLFAAALAAACDSGADKVFGEPVDAAVVSAASGTGGAGGAQAASSTDAATGVGGGFTVAASQAVSSSVGATSSAAGGVDPTLCEPKPNDNECYTCTKTKCCVELEACAGDTTCTCMLICTLQNKLTCYSDCKSNFNQQPWASFSACLTTKCAIACL